MASKSSILGGALGAYAIKSAFMGPTKNDLKTPPSGAGPAQTGFGISEIRAEALNRIGIARSTRGSLTMTAPPALMSGADVVSKLMSYYITDFNVPGAQIITTDIRRYGTGRTVKYPVSSQTGDISVSMIVDGQGLIYRFLYLWMNSVTNYDTRINGMVETKYNGNLHDVSYMRQSGSLSRLGAEAILTVHSENSESPMTAGATPGIAKLAKPVLMYKVQDMYPIAMSDINMSWGATNGLATMTVKFACTGYTIEDALPSNLTPQQGTATVPNISSFGRVIQAATIAQAVASVKKPQSIGDILSVVNNTAMIAKILSR